MRLIFMNARVTGAFADVASLFAAAVFLVLLLQPQ